MRKMFRKLFIFSLIFTTSLLTSCSSLSDEDKMSLIKNGDIVLKEGTDYEYDEFTRPIHEEEILSLLDNKEDFVLYNAMNSCSACQTVKPIVLKYVLQSSALLRHIDTDRKSTRLNSSHQIISY